MADLGFGGSSQDGTGRARRPSWTSRLAAGAVRNLRAMGSFVGVGTRAGRAEPNRMAGFSSHGSDGPAPRTEAATPRATTETARRGVEVATADLGTRRDKARDLWKTSNPLIAAAAAASVESLIKQQAVDLEKASKHLKIVPMNSSDRPAGGSASVHSMESVPTTASPQTLISKPTVWPYFPSDKSVESFVSEGRNHRMEEQREWAVKHEGRLARSETPPRPATATAEPRSGRHNIPGMLQRGASIHPNKPSRAATSAAEIPPSPAMTRILSVLRRAPTHPPVAQAPVHPPVDRAAARAPVAQAASPVIKPPELLTLDLKENFQEMIAKSSSHLLWRETATDSASGSKPPQHDANKEVRTRPSVEQLYSRTMEGRSL